tara:strand:+ start:442 stop:711 length:270 start_codon:yes stop_codon:yes gene_type:complete
MVEQFPPDFINALKAIIKNVDNNPYAITNAMNISKEEKRMDAYYTFEAALAYFTYTKIIDKENMEKPIENLINKMKENLDILSSGTTTG